MKPTIKQPAGVQTIDRRMMLLLRRKGTQSMEDLVSMTGASWEQVFFSVDRLSRAGKVSLTVVRPCEYQVSLAASIH